MAERRLFIRIGFSTPAWLVQADGQQHQSEVKDISLQGALVTVTEPWTVQNGEPVELRLALDGYDQHITMLAYQRFHQPGAIGLECQQLDINSAEHLRRLVELNLGDEALLLRQFEELIDDRKTE
ncbi:cyclic diguanosine monophosphate-binding protein [Oceanisphaera marina]|uniref:Cyclic diguanosine monophosphate-binding protein n=1 Tax=Oceanisphaera marina TaxID=2017550 RepID=A0ABQ1ISP2_9GAMM|nr:PilZ domain-containing protein [Oceanisphaera marina]GGB49515.1 cyclic diguanosine monophosphate-binding protein [Oceanisphaera marina]